MRFLFKLDAPATRDVTINYYTRPHDPPPDGAAQATTIVDYTPVLMGTATIQSGELEKPAEITIIDDELYELPETFELVWEFVPSDPCVDPDTVPKLHQDVNRLSTDSELHPPDHSDLALRCRPVDPLYWKVASVGTIENDDSAPQLFVSSPSVEENASPMNFTVSLGAPTAVNVTFDYQTAPGDLAHGALATSGTDYTTHGPPPESGFIPANETTPQAIPIPGQITPDSDPEPDENFILSINNVQHARTATNPLDGIAGRSSMTIQRFA